MSRDKVIQITELTKVFGRAEKRVKALDGVSFEVARGQVIGLLGPNGAGKTTTIHHLLGLTTPDSGRVKVFGLDVNSNRRQVLSRVNFASAAISLPANLSAWENMMVYGRLYGLARPKAKVLELMDRFEISGALKRKTGALSSGQQTRLGLCKAFINDPEILFLDEPTSSLDPDIADKVRRTLKEIQASHGLTIVYTSHNMAEIEQMCDEVVFLSLGKIVAQGRPDEVLARADKASLEELFIDIARQGIPAGQGGR